MISFHMIYEPSVSFRRNFCKPCEMYLYMAVSAFYMAWFRSLHLFDAQQLRLGRDPHGQLLCGRCGSSTRYEFRHLVILGHKHMNRHLNKHWNMECQSSTALCELKNQSSTACSVEATLLHPEL